MNPDPSPLRERIRGELDSLRRRSRYRTLESFHGVNLYSNDYLGLARDPRLLEATALGIRRAGQAGSGGSRLLAGNSREWESVESEFAAFIGTQAALYFSSGYAANLGALSALLRPEDMVFSDNLNHASLIDGMRLSGAQKFIYPHNDLAQLERLLLQSAGENGAKLIATESVFSMEGDTVPLAKVVELARRYGAEVVIDEAHAIGVRGPGGRGLAVETGVHQELLAAIYPCGKALGSAGAFVCGGATLIDYLVNRARTFIFSTAAPPYMAHQLRAAIRLVRSMDAERKHLENISRKLRDGLRAESFDLGTSDSQIVPIILGTSEAALAFAESLREDGFGVRAIRPPTVPEGSARVRLSLTAGFASSDIERLIAACLRARECAVASRAAESAVAVETQLSCSGTARGPGHTADGETT